MTQHTQRRRNPDDHKWKHKPIETRDPEDYTPTLIPDCEDCENRDIPCPECSEKQFLAILELRRN